ncbi:sugar dehydrogenase complex small subunit [Pseudomonas sp. NPDC007930]|uniref:sugar dehydrogenase complex small subunit n=1 Tax=Pseudomonas sp. NPDC007930 TaxID=3364417 RepID=UPI0036EA0DE9
MPPANRRTLLKALLAAYAAGLLPALAAPPAADEQAAFLALSAYLVGRDYLDPAQGRPLFEALCADAGDFPARCLALLGQIHDRQLPPETLQRTLDAERSPLAGLPRQVLRAWLAGVVGDGARARCLAYETALNAQMVADVLRPPSYAYGAYGSWAERGDG